ncbi:MAG: hypothetical protein QM765_11520 [Myxococcales bacterium]
MRPSGATSSRPPRPPRSRRSPRSSPSWAPSPRRAAAPIRRAIRAKTSPRAASAWRRCISASPAWPRPAPTTISRAPSRSGWWEQAKLIRADAVAHKNAEALGARIDLSIEHLAETNRWLSDLAEFKDLTTQLPPVPAGSMLNPAHATPPPMPERGQN